MQVEADSASTQQPKQLPRNPIGVHERHRASPKPPVLSRTVGSRKVNIRNLLRRHKVASKD
jgi:hypothetical protein